MNKKNKRVSILDTHFYNTIDYIILGLISISVLIFILWPILCVIKSSLFIDGDFTLELYDKLFTNNKKLLYNSVFVATLSAALSTILSVAIALKISFMRGKKKLILMGILMVTMISPPFVSSLAYIQLFGRRGLITYRLLKLSLNPYGWHGIVAMQSLSFASLNALLLIGIISKLDMSLVQSSLDLGSSHSYALRKIIIPLVKPAILVCFLLSFVRSLSDFGTPMTIGGAFDVLATEIYMQIIGYGNLELAAAMNVIILIPALVIFIVYRKLMKKYNILSKGTSNKVSSSDYTFSLKGIINWGITLICGVFFTMMILQYLTIFISGITKFSYGKMQFTLDHFKYLKLYSMTSFVRSIVYGIIVGIVGTIIGILLSYYTERRKIRGMEVLDFIGTLPYIIPGTFFGIGYILAFNNPPLMLTGTAAIVIINCIFKQLPMTTKTSSAALSQINVNLEEAGRDLGAGKFHIIKDIIFPNLKNAFVVGFINNFTTSMTTIGAIIFLIHPGKKIATLALFDAINSGEYGVGSLIATIIIIITMIVNLGISRIILGKGSMKNVSSIE
ncbi:iron ABC transporter permease [Clostridium subterminale]|uniref:Iron ABC transporter permease n=1 Tax=Clostridium subterminale TaxID=1550 RepID=A0ABP3VVF4_CLOSU